MITQSRLKELYQYSPDTGEFIRLTSAGGYKKFTVAGSIDTYGYAQVSIDGKKVLAHRLAWLYMHGSLPKDEIDHKNGNRADNRIDNLRESDRQSNNHNSRIARKTSESGVLGVSKKDGKFQARITLNRKQIYLGFFNTKEEASEAYVTAKRKLHSSCTI
jgi:hypothetical protein